jgi:predicted ATPase
MRPRTPPMSSIEFGRCRILVLRRQLLVDGRPVDLGGRVFDLLMTLIENRGTVMSKTGLMRRVWPGRVVEETNLMAAISALRKALGPDRDVIRTLVGRGYQFVSEIREPALAPAPPHLTNLPTAASALICRETALSEISAMIMQHRLLTLSGAGGIGKTRLAIDTGRNLLPRFPDGVWIADLAPLADPDLVPATVAVALGLSSSGMAAGQIADSVGIKHTLVVLDNCEHVISVAARMASELLRAGPNIFVLCTSREPLRTEGEWVYQVQPLDVPEEDAKTLDDILATGAGKLLLMRARAAQPHFQPDASVAARLAVICRRLDGMPLAIEFAAARTAVLGVEDVAVGLDQRFRLLTGGRRTALPRHQTLRATLDWSYELLAENDRQALCRLAVFAGEFTLEAARAILVDTEVSAHDVEEHVAVLAHKSLLSVHHRGAVARYRMLETTRAYALEKLAERGELTQFAQRHAQYHLVIFKRATVEWRTRPLAEWSHDYCHLIDDARVALDWAFSSGGDPAMGAELTVAVVPIWTHLSLLEELTKRAEHALRTVTSNPPSDPRHEMQLSAVLSHALVHTRGMEPKGQAACRKALAIAEQLHDTEYQLVALADLCKRALGRGHCGAALSLAQEFCRVAAIRGDPSALNVGDVMTGYARLLMGNPSEARRHIESVLSREISANRRFLLDDFEIGFVAGTRARALWFQGFPDQAVRIVTKTADDAILANHAITLGDVLGLSACPIAILVGDWVEAQRWVKLLLDLPKMGPWYQSWARSLQAALLIKRGEVDCGVQALRDALRENSKINHTIYEVVLTVILAEGLGASGQVPAALTLINETLAQSNANDALWFMPEQLRVKGELILLTGVPDAAAEAESYFVQSLELARRQKALSWELRTATSLAHLRQRQCRSSDGMEVLQPVYARFTEGFDTADLVAARTLLGTLRGLHAPAAP